MENPIDKNKKALEIAFDIGRFKVCLDEYLSNTAPFKSIRSVIRNVGICMALYYNNMESAGNAWCRIMISEREDVVEKAISYDAYEQEAAVNQITNLIKKNVPVDEECIKYNEIGYKGNPEFSNNYLIVFAAFKKSVENDSQKTLLLRQLIVDFLYQTVDDMEKLQILFNKGETYLRQQKYNFVEKYTGIVRDHYKLPSEKLYEKIVSTGYENRKCTGKMIFVSDKEPDGIVHKLDSTENYKVTNEKITRKLLESAKDEYYMVVDTTCEYRIAGYMKIKKEDRKAGELYIIFEGASGYSILSYPEEVLVYKNGEYYASKEDNEEANRRICEENNDIPGLEEILNRCNEIDHGALIIFAEDAAEICDSLCKKYKRGYVVQPFYIQNNIDFVIQMASVDGAILADNQGKCYAYGVMLDGEAKTIGNPERGSRYNSAVNYIYGKNRTAVIISEDKDKPVCVKNGMKLLKEENK